MPRRFFLQGLLKFLTALLLAGELILLSIQASCRKESAQSAGETLAWVGGERIGTADLTAALNETGGDIPIPQGDALRNLKKDLLEQVIQTRLFLLEARRMNLGVSKEELGDNLKKYQAEYSGEEFNQLLKSKGLTYDRWVEKIRENVLIQKLEEKATESVSDPGPDEIKAYYDSHPDEHQMKPGVRIRQILLGTEKEAREVHEALLKGADFAVLAHEKSISPDRDSGGDLGYLTRDQMPEGFEVTLTLPLHSISPVIKTSYGYHIFRVEERQGEQEIPLASDSARIKTLLRQERKDKAFAKWAIDLRNRTEIKLMADAIREFEK